MQSDSPKPKAAKVIGGAGQVVAGVFLGALPYLVAWHVFFSDDRLNVGEKILMGLIFGVWIMLGALVVHGIMTALLLFWKYRAAAIGIWLAYPLLVVSVIGHQLLVEIEESSIPPKDYSRLEVIRPSGEVRDLLLVMYSRNHDPSGFVASNFCHPPCMSLLRAGVLESIAKTRDGGGFNVFRHARGEACHAAERNFERYNELLRVRGDIAQQVRDLTSVLDSSGIDAGRQKARDELEHAQHSLQRTESQYREVLETTRTHAHGGHALASWGYFEECITTTFHDSVEYDIRISYGIEASQPEVPRWGYTDILEFRDGKQKLLARFEAGVRKGPAEPFSVAEIIAGLMGRPIDTTITPFPVESVEAELKRLAALVEGGAYFGGWPYLASWIGEVIEREAAQRGFQKLVLSADEVDILLAMAPTGPEWMRERFFDKIYDHVAMHSIKSLIKGGAPDGQSGR